jgi:tRNA threonylcarbamoyladenosine biosynthesis protein TsaB
MARLIALDTSTERLVVSLDDDGTIRTLDEAGGGRASVRIVPAVLQLLEAAGLRVRDLDAVGFGRGPGAFTGLRTACAVAQGLAFGAARPVLALDSLLVVAEDARVQLGVAQQARFDAWVAMDARMDEAYAAAYEWDGAHWHVRAAPALYALDALQARWRDEPPAVVAGSALAAFEGRLSTQGARGVPVPQDRAGALARVARMAWHDGAAVDPALALPLYLRDKVAFTVAERAATAAQGQARGAQGAP